MTTWNCRTLFGSIQATEDQTPRVLLTWLVLDKIVALSYVVLLQETHRYQGALATLRHRFPDFFAR